MNYTLIFPPMWAPTQPYLSIPSLTAYLRKQGHNVTQNDLNIEYIEWLCNSEKISELFQRLDTCCSSNVDLIEVLILLKDTLTTSGKDYLEILRNSNTFFSSSPNEYQSSLNAITNIFKLLSLIYNPQKINIGYYDCGVNMDNDSCLFAFLCSLENSPFYEFYKEFLENIKNIDQQLIGISIISQDQLIPGLILSKMIKKLYPSVSVCVGGSIITRLKDTILSNSQFFSIFDYAIIFEGEEPLNKLGKALEYQLDLKQVPNLLFKLGEKSYYTFTQQNLDMDILPTPDFGGLLLDKYLSPCLALPLLTTRGCYWNRCSFCDHSYIYNSRFRMRSIDNLIKDIQSLHDKYGVNYFSFVDECIPPKVFEELVTRLNCLPFKIYWNCDLRFDKSFVRDDLFDVAYESGLRTIFFGLESGSQKILNLMNKGTTIKDIEEILTTSSNAGIFNHLFAIYGFPGETKETLTQTKSFLQKHIDSIHSIGFARFSLNKFSPISSDLKSYDITSLQDKGNLRLGLEFEYTSGIDIEQINEIEYEVNQNNFVPIYAYDNFTEVYHRDLWHIYLSKYKLTDVKEFYGDMYNKGKISKGDRIQLAKNTYYKISNKQNSVYIYNLETATTLELTLSTELILTMLKTPISLEEVIREIGSGCSDFSEDMEKELIVFINQLFRRNFIEKI